MCGTAQEQQANSQQLNQQVTTGSRCTEEGDENAGRAETSSLQREATGVKPAEPRA